MRLPVVLCFALLCGLATQSPAAEWPGFRGPMGTGATTADPPTQWGPDTNVRWKTPIPGRGSSTPVVSGGRVFLLTAIDTGLDGEPEPTGGNPGPAFMLAAAPTTVHAFDVLAYDLATGEKLWQTTAVSAVPSEPGHKTTTFAPATPCVAGGVLYASFGSYGIFAIDAETGETKWSRDLGQQVTRAQFGEGASPSVDVASGTLIVPWDDERDSKLYALDAATGETKWSVERDERTTWSTPLITEFDGRTQVVCNGGTVRSYDIADGSLIWQCSGMTGNPIPTPVRFEDSVICMTGYQGYAVKAIALSAEGDVTDKDAVLWSRTDAAPYVPSPVLAGGRLWFCKSSNGVVSAVDAKTGERVAGPGRLPGVSSLYASPAAVDGLVYFTGREGATTILDAAADDIFALATNETGEPVDASPVPVGDAILIRGEKHLFCFGE